MRSIFLIVFLSLALPVSSAWSADATVRMWAANCQVCHGPQGKSQGAIPSINVLTPEQIKTAIADYASDKRHSTIMGTIARGFAPDRVAAIAEFLGKK